MDQVRKADFTPFNTHIPIEVNGKYYELWAIVGVATDQELSNIYKYYIPVKLDQIVLHRQHLVGVNNQAGEYFYMPEGQGAFEVGVGSEIRTGVRVAVNGSDSFLWSCYVLYYA